MTVDNLERLIDLILHVFGTLAGNYITVPVPLYRVSAIVEKVIDISQLIKFKLFSKFKAPPPHGARPPSGES